MDIIFGSLLFTSFIFAWLHFQRFALLLVSVLITLGYYKTYFSFSALLFFLVLGYLVYLYKLEIKSRLLLILITTSMLSLNLAFSLHKITGIQNIKIFDSIYFSSNSNSYTMFLNFDKPIFALFYLIAFAPLLTGKSNIKNTAFILMRYVPLLLISIIPIGLYFGFIKLDIKFPDEFWLWALNNLFITCASEEIVFRGFLQKSLTEKFANFNHGSTAALVISALIFGLFHFAGGLSYVLLSTVAGFFYGLIYKLSKSLEAAVLSHFALNLVHFIFFTYPSAIH